MDWATVCKGGGWGEIVAPYRAWITWECDLTVCWTVVMLSCTLLAVKHFPTSDFMMDYHAPLSGNDKLTVLRCILALYQISACLTLVCCLINLPCWSSVSRLMYLFTFISWLFFWSLFITAIDMLLYRTVVKLSCTLSSGKHFPTSDFVIDYHAPLIGQW